MRDTAPVGRATAMMAEVHTLTLGLGHLREESAHLTAAASAIRDRLDDARERHRAVFRPPHIVTPAGVLVRED